MHSAATPSCQDPGVGKDPVLCLLPSALPGHLEFPCEEESTSRLEVLPVLNFSCPGLLRQNNIQPSTQAAPMGAEARILIHPSAVAEAYRGGMSEAW